MRERAGLFDQSSFAKYEIEGRDAGAALSRMCANDVARPPGRVTYTQMLNSRGGIECDLTVSRLADDHFYIVTGTGFRTHDLAWIRDHIEARADAVLHDVTEDFGTLALMGPAARAHSQPGDRGGCIERGLSLRPCAGAGTRRPTGAGVAHHLCRRTGL